jgi:hypothetical protein
MRDPGLVALLDPLAIIEGHYQVLDPQDRYCTAINPSDGI